MQNWLPPEQIKQLQMPTLTDFSSLEKEQKKKDKTIDKSNAANKLFSIPPEAVNDLKKALEVSLNRKKMKNNGFLKNHSVI